MEQQELSLIVHPLKAYLASFQERILLIGEDPVLLEARALLLSDWLTSRTAAAQASALMRSIAFSVVIIGHSVPDDRVTELLKEARSLRSAPDVLLLRSPNRNRNFEVETYTYIREDHPGWIKTRVAELLAGRAGAGIE